MTTKADEAYLKVRQWTAKDRDGYILTCALEGAQARLRDSLKADDFWPTKSTAMEIGAHRGLIFYLMECRGTVK